MEAHYNKGTCKLSSKLLSIFLSTILILSSITLSIQKVYASSSPATPTGLTAISGSSMVTLSWDDNRESDLVFYRVYKDGLHYRTYNKDTTTVEVTGLIAEQDYMLGVTAVDSSNNESAISEKVSAPLSVAITQSSVVSIPSENHPPYTTFFHIGEAGPIIPGLEQYLIPQGLTYEPNHDWLITFNYRPGDQSAMLTIMNGSSGAFLKSMTIYNADKTPYTGHAGGVVVSTFDIWISGMGYLHRIPLEDIDIAPDQSRVYIVDRFKTGNVAAFTLYRDGVLWTGEFHEASDFPTSNSHHKTTRNGGSNRAWMIGFTLNPATGRLPPGKYIDDNIAVIPDRIISITDKIQGAANLTNRGIALSQSYGRDNNSKIYFYEDVLSQPPHYYTTVAGSLVPSWFLDHISLDSQLIAPPMTEGIVVKNDLLHVLFESASDEYLTIDKDTEAETINNMLPLDSIWKLNISDLMN